MGMQHQLNKLFRSSLQADKTRQILDTFREELDVRSKWMWLKALRKGYTPAPYHWKNKGGQHIALTQRAEEVATFLSTAQWGTNGEDSNP